MRKNLLVFLIAIVASLALASTASAAPFVFSNNNDITVPDNNTLANASQIELSMPGLVTRVEVRLNDINHTRPGDLDIMLESPSGEFIYLMSDNCGATAMANKFLEIADDQPNVMAQTSLSCGPPDQRPSDHYVGSNDDVWSTAPTATPVTSFASLTGKNESGTWKLHVADDSAGETGTISGWEIRIDTTMPDALRLPTAGDLGTAGPFTKSVNGFPRAITDVDVWLNDLTHTFPEELDFGIESPLGTKVVFASDGCGSAQPRNTDLIFDDESSSQYPEIYEPGCETNLHRFQPVNREIQETALGGILTGGPFGSALSAFDGQFANGNWKLYVDDNANGDMGFISGYDLAITIRGAKALTASDPTIKAKKSGKSIRATGRVSLAGEALTAGECAGSVKSTFQSITTKKKGKKKVTTYKKIVSVNSNLTEVAGVCGFDISAKLSTKYSGKKVRLVTSYLGGTYIAPFTRTTTEKVKKIKFK